MYSQQIGICLLLTICLFEAAYAVKCYQCESISNEACGEDFNTNMVPYFDCSKAPRPRFILGTKNSTSCVKMVKEENGKTNIVRACFFENANTPSAHCLIDPNAPAIFKSCDLCTTDFCNSSTSLYGSVAAIFFSTLLVLKSFV